MKKRKVLYPGSFDPITYGHIDVIRRALCLYDEVVVAVARNPEKKPIFKPEDRVKFIHQVFKGNRRVKVTSFNGLVVNFARKEKVSCLLRGLRATSDFEYEFQMALTNRKMAPEIETVFLTPSEEFFYISSRVIKALAVFDGSLEDFAPKHVIRALKTKFSHLKN